MEFDEQGPFEPHYTAKQVAVSWSVDETTIRRIFQDRDDVLKIGKAARRDGKRDYINLRIPKSVVMKVYRAGQKEPIKSS